MDNVSEQKLTFNNLTEELTVFISKNIHSDANESVVNLSTFFAETEDKNPVYISNAVLRETCRVAYLIPYKQTQYKTRKIIFRPDKENREMKISLHEIFLSSEGGEEVKKRKFRFYIKMNDLSRSFLLQCQKYMLFRISNQDLIKSIPRVKTTGLEF